MIRAFRILAVFMLLLLHCKDVKYKRVEDEKVQGATVTIRNFVRDSFKIKPVKDKEGKPIPFEGDIERDYRLRAEESYVFSKEGKTILYGIDFDQYEKGKYESNLKANHGVIDNATEKVNLDGDILLVTKENRTLAGEEITYDTKNKKVRSDSHVIINSEGTRIEGVGLRADRNLNKFTILKPSAISTGGGNPIQSALGSDEKK